MEEFSYLSWQELVRLLLQEYRKQLIFKHWERTIFQETENQYLIKQDFQEKNYSLKYLSEEQKSDLQALKDCLDQIWQETQINRDYLLKTLITYFEANLAFESCFQELFV